MTRDEQLAAATRVIATHRHDQTISPQEIAFHVLSVLGVLTP